MALKIRLARGGAKKRPVYRIVVADVRAPRDGRFIEILGTYNPLLPKDSDERVTLKTDRIRHWLSNGAKPTDRVNRFLDAADILKREPRNNPQKAIPRSERGKDPASEAPATDTAKDTASETPAAEPAKDAASEAPAAEPAKDAEPETPAAETAKESEPETAAANA